MKKVHNLEGVCSVDFCGGQIKQYGEFGNVSKQLCQTDVFRV